MLGSPRNKSWILDSRPRIPDSRRWILVFGSGGYILDSSLWWDSGFLELYSGFQSPGFQIPPTKRSRIPDSLTWVEVRFKEVLPRLIKVIYIKIRSTIRCKSIKIWTLFDLITWNKWSEKKSTLKLKVKITSFLNSFFHMWKNSWFHVLKPNEHCLSLLSSTICNSFAS